MGAVGREALDQPMAHGVGGLEADAAALDLVGGADRVVERRRADHVPDGLNRAAALGPAQLRHVPFEGDYQVLGVHAAPRSTRLTIWRRGDRCVSILV